MRQFLCRVDHLQRPCTLSEMSAHKHHPQDVSGAARRQQYEEMQVSDAPVSTFEALPLRKNRNIHHASQYGWQSRAPGCIDLQGRESELSSPQHKLIDFIHTIFKKNDQQVGCSSVGAKQKPLLLLSVTQLEDACVVVVPQVLAECIPAQGLSSNVKVCRQRGLLQAQIPSAQLPVDRPPRRQLWGRCALGLSTCRLHAANMCRSKPQQQRLRMPVQQLKTAAPCSNARLLQRDSSSSAARRSKQSAGGSGTLHLHWMLAVPQQRQPVLEWRTSAHSPAHPRLAL